MTCKYRALTHTVSEINIFQQTLLFVSHAKCNSNVCKWFSTATMERRL